MAEREFEVTGAQVLEEIGKVAFAPAGDGAGAELKYSNKLKALEMLSKLLGLHDRPVEGQSEGRTGVVLMPEVVCGGTEPPLSQPAADSSPARGEPRSPQRPAATDPLTGGAEWEQSSCLPLYGGGGTASAVTVGGHRDESM